MKPRTVAITSINQVAAGIKRAVEMGILKEGMRALDWGGGRFDTGRQFLASHGIEARIFDPYARSFEENQDAIAWALVKEELPDVVFLNNVLCVIPTTKERREVIRAAWRYVRKGGYLVITNYEGDKSDVVKGYQNNREHFLYLSEIHIALGGDFMQTRKGKVYFFKKL
jgi:hypothetical protein